ncbi:hydroxymethylpyrimidine/phosphomethylpyrimidine kinase [Nesterenkonia sp. HG001]|uniref:hydroxymethylpyrimidine/phosphomethylpyrimidine kinase n=1 Tax=Nesterenkonia sp. HG001 TaxID=2983207 RepID=UPI002AC44747|nr:hydroxymethylpyrimidine/phosphomethylpyrimidine kinase [Nesterenkonia sp. HG001]MDZ5076438.1 hydroxymethylpyrimidine/phosphomethylpyrimidine kinase [Nesterenkonia sp. HG001]
MTDHFPQTTRPPMTLTIAGSEATGGAGAQADLKTFQELGSFGIIALTCIVSFDPKDSWNHRFVPVEPQVIAEQIEAVFGDYDADALDTVKLGMMGSPATISTVGQAIRERRPRHVVLDPVLICKGQEPGHALDTDNALKTELLPQATFVTPNHFETEQLSGMAVRSLEDLTAAAQEIHRISGAAVLAKGGVRLEGPEAVDVFVGEGGTEVLRAPKIGEHAVSGAGCSLAAAVAAKLSQGATPLEAARRAKEFVTAGIRQRVAGGTPFDALWQGGLRRSGASA